MSKKMLKRTGVAVLSMAMLLSMGALAATSASATSASAVDMTAETVTIANTYGGTYDVYKVLDATVAAGGLTYTYDFATGFSSAACGYTVAQIAAVDASNASDMKALADALVRDSADATPVNGATPIDAGGTISLTPGYYLITCAGGTQMTVAPTLISVRSDTTTGTVTPKTSSLTLDKYITGVAQGTAAQVVGTTDGEAKPNSAQAAVGNVVSYAIEAKTPKYAPTVTTLTGSYQIVDTPSAGLTYVANSIVVYCDINGNGTFEDATEKIYYHDGTDAHYVTFGDPAANIVTVSGTTVTFDNDFILANQDKAVKVTLDTTVNANAVTVENTNQAVLNYNNDYYEGSDTDSLTDIVKVYAAKLEITKTFSDNPASGSYPIAGFTLYKDSIDAANVVATASTTASDNTLTFNELAAGIYILVETTVPDGYVKADNVTFTLAANKTGTEYNGTYVLLSATGAAMDATNKIVTSTVSNVKGATLPGTGGIGTIIFTVGGASIVLLAGVMFVLYMRKRKAEEE